MSEIIAPQLSILIHDNDYTVFKSPVEEFMQALEDAGLRDRVQYLSHGETYNFNL
ncbi:hypothetical protein [Gloeocapsopsis sp. IPPAS B-1203]|uniref:hypothetical protein n=1 Tax=Gloeocapsopsis sp. IPPAS B-1203 TaxID=2049454 RepID=UPI0025A2C418|nr:hypothetical protein [Gloeocapsopsis sp. IPPAS B-1203]